MGSIVNNQKLKIEGLESKVEEFKLKVNVAEQMKKFSGVSPNRSLIG